MLVNLMKGGPFGPAITTGGATFAALGSFLANGVPPSLRSAAHGQGVTHRTHTQTDLMIAKQAQEMLKFIQM
ncbi:hypothetical protein PR003_g32180 [Phytophthora rubi]|uniref:Uncharacterized protein n=1 Tax=Phytophthora rubi TaxID=129364 RepID=A0A6A4B4Q7_9STRA|nr:hypothetical protein PR001_g30669 [Phytophthora rubi]KAE8996556.1 hypothetical protein PR002_g19291 [Phytophthora rubi]KAE9266278.1 hypothetical protein PR003_g32180 [Phytophthora rubi]